MKLLRFLIFLLTLTILNFSQFSFAAPLTSSHKNLTEYLSDLQTLLMAKSKGEATLERISEIQKRSIATFLNRAQLDWLNKKTNQKEVQDFMAPSLSKLNTDQFITHLEASHLSEVYKLFPKTLNLHDSLNSFRKRMDPEVKKETLAIIEQIQQESRRWTVKEFGNPERLVKDAEEVGLSKLYSGFTASDAKVIYQFGYRDGRGYGSGGSKQLRAGIYSTDQFKSAFDWGTVKNRTKENELFKGLPVAVLEMEISPKARILDAYKHKKFITGFAADIESTVSDSNNTLGKRLRELHPQIPEHVWSEGRYELLLRLLDADILRSIIMIADGLGGGIEYIVSNRNVITESTYKTNPTTEVSIKEMAKQVDSIIKKLGFPSLDRPDDIFLFFEKYRGPSKLKLIETFYQLSGQEQNRIIKKFVFSAHGKNIIETSTHPLWALGDELFRNELLEDQKYKDQLVYILERDNFNYPVVENYYEKEVGRVRLEVLRRSFSLAQSGPLKCKERISSIFSFTIK